MLGPGAGDAELLRATALNHRAWFARFARAGGGEVHADGGVWWSATPGGVTIAFPRLARARAGESIDAVVAAARRLRAPEIGCWTLAPPVPRELGAYLVGRGFQWGWEPHWMALDLTRLGRTKPPSGVLLEVVETQPDWHVDALPYYSRAAAGVLGRLARARPRRIWHVAAIRDGSVVGHAMLNVTGGRLGVAGVYNVGVLPPERRRGIGRAATAEVCRIGRELGCRYAVLNSTGEGEPLYRQMGFRSLGYGLTWWLHRPADRPRPPRPQVGLADAIGQSDLDALARLARRVDLGARLPGGLTPLELAATLGQERVAGRLLELGAPLEPLPAWMLGWKDRVRELFAGDPAAAARPVDDRGATMLHHAVERDDPELLEIALAGGAALDVRDRWFGATPLEWARNLGRADLARKLEAARSARRRDEQSHRRPPRSTKKS